MSDER